MLFCCFVLRVFFVCFVLFFHVISSFRSCIYISTRFSFSNLVPFSQIYARVLYQYNDVDDEREDTANVWGAIFLMFQVR